MRNIITLVDKVFDKSLEYEIYVHDCGFELTMCIDKDLKFKNQIKKEKKILKSLKKTIEVEEDLGYLTNEKVNEYAFIKRNVENLFDFTDYIIINFEDTNIYDYIINNPVLLNKKILLSNKLEISDYDKLLELMNEFQGLHDKIYVMLDGNMEPVNLIDCSKTMNEIKKQSEEIKKLNLSKMEAIMYTYDKVRNRVYKEESIGEDEVKSRDITKVLFGDKIVCAGYAGLFKALLHYQGINCVKINIYDKDDCDMGHARNIIYIKDEKYNIDGIYIFDPTWDSKRREGSNSYLNSYKYFAKTKDYMDKNDNNSFDCDFFFDINENTMDEIKRVLESGYSSELIEYTRKINTISRLVLGVPLIHLYSMFRKKLNVDSVIEEFKLICDKFDKEIPAETMLDLLNNVRKVEYYTNPNWYPYNVKDLLRTLYNSDWNFEKERMSPTLRLYNAIFDKVPPELSKKENFKEYTKESILKDVGGVRIVNAIRKVYIKKLEDNNK